jgi:vanillate O-demethylase monooxygenase subunit
MFSQVDHARSASDLPRGCTFRDSDWHILARFWHPVAFAHDIADAPASARLLDVDLVIWRSAQGVSVARDLCPHRGTRLSAGRVAGDRLICPMHGLEFDPTGACTRIPSNGDPNARIPPRLRLASLRVAERYGIVWACLSDDPLWPLPDWPGIGDAALPKVFVPPDTWRAAASRHVENFNDVAHFPFVHQATFGGADRPVPDYEVQHTDYGLRFDLEYLEGGNRFPDGVAAEERQVVYTYQLTFPFSTIILIQPRGSDYVQYFADTVCPVSAHETRIFQVATDTTGRPDTDFLIAESRMINNEDKPMVEGQHPEDLPLDLTEEVHIPADRLSVAYRRALAKRFGLGAPLTS